MITTILLMGCRKARVTEIKEETTARYHLNEAYNNLGTAYFESGKMKEAKAAWEQALVLLPSDRTVRENLIEFIYQNPALPGELREISPFVQAFLTRPTGSN